jgi:TonB family protein
MIQRSWFFRNGLFYTILALVLLLHIIFMALKMYRDFAVVETRVPQAINVKIVSDPRVNLKKQIVQSEDPETLNKPVDKSYLSDKDRKFDRQSVARKIDLFKSSGKGNPTKESLSLSDLGAFKKGHNPLSEAAKSTSLGTKSGDVQKRGISSTNDFVEDVPLGDLTYLNTVEYKYYGFFFRIRQKLEQFWGRSIQEKANSIMKEGRRVASNDNLITSLEVTLNKLGQIVSVVINGSSGVQELDDAAIESFNQAGPFPNPPQGLIKNGVVKIAWGFVVKT